MNELRGPESFGRTELILLRRTSANAPFWESLRFDCSKAARDDWRQWVREESVTGGAAAPGSNRPKIGHPPG